MNWDVLLSTFGLMFIAELGDKTQLAVLTQTCKFRRPGTVFVGATLALTLVTALGAAGGQIVGRFVPADVVRLVAAAGFIVMGLLIAWEAWKGGRMAPVDACSTECAPDEDAARTNPAWRWKAFSSTFVLLFLAEMGDKTQLAVLGLTGRHHTPLTVFAGGALALTAVTALGVVGGQGLTRVIPERVLHWISAAAFVVMGGLMAFGVL